MNNLQTQWKNQKRFRGVGYELSIKDKIKALRPKSGLSLRACQKKNVDFTDSSNTIFWPKNIAKEEQTVEKKYFYICQY